MHIHGLLKFTLKIIKPIKNNVFYDNTHIKVDMHTHWLANGVDMFAGSHVSAIDLELHTQMGRLACLLQIFGVAVPLSLVVSNHRCIMSHVHIMLTFRLTSLNNISYDWCNLVLYYDLIGWCSLRLNYIL